MSGVAVHFAHLRSVVLFFTFASKCVCLFCCAGLLVFAVFIIHHPALAEWSCELKRILRRTTPLPLRVKSWLSMRLCMNLGASGSPGQGGHPARPAGADFCRQAGGLQYPEGEHAAPGAAPQVRRVLAGKSGAQVCVTEMKHVSFAPGEG